MEWVIIGFVVVGVIMWTRSRQQQQHDGAPRYGGYGARPSARQLSQEELDAVRRAADEDVTQFGEELQRLDTYEDAKASASAVRGPEEIQHVTEILGDGRYAVACVRARVAGEPLPARRPPCFFNPQHGPSVRDVPWAPDGGSPRDVPACALDAERVDAGAEPASRQVMVGSRRMPYWQAGPAFAPFGAGYFGAFGLMGGLFMGTMLGASLDGSDGSYADGYDDGQDSGDGGSDGGGGDAGDGGAMGGDGGDMGGDMGDFGGFGGMDFGGGDFGGGDF
jgi:hypothetical protein